ncbi:MAG: hypothetical protein L3J35_01090 [Bacteroidales bacterium]|nr:hypothetical protein [Bacteroidales bacterium]
MKTFTKNKNRLFAILVILFSSIVIALSMNNFSLNSILNSKVNPKSDFPHNFTCNACHILHTSPGISLTSVQGNANLCMSCHNPTGVANLKPFSVNDKAVPGTKGTSHSWDVSGINNLYAANLPTEANMLLRIINDTIICSTCHNQHSQAFTPFLRADNTADAMCKDCHSARNLGLYATDNTNNRGTHPVGVVYNGADSRLFSVPNAPLLAIGGNVECSSCHKLHYATTTDGNLLRKTNDASLCTSCHVYKNFGTSLDHESMTCVTCHYAHQNNSGNIFLVRDVINTPNSGAQNVVFTANTSADNYADATGTFDGVCEVCHTLTDHYTNTTGGTADARHVPATQTCISCHPHDNAFYAQSNCFDCHNTVQDKPAVGPVGGRRQIVDDSGDGLGTGGDFKRSSHHVSGAIPNVSDCLKCHYMGDHKNGEVKLFDPDQGYLNVITYDPVNKASIEDFCLNCHDADGSNGDTTPFSDGIAVPLVDKTLWNGSSHKTSVYTCLDCHDNGHGSNKSKLLEPFDYTADATPDPMNDQEEFCERCHSAAGAATSDIESEFNLTHSHQVDEVAEMGTNSGLECINCHNPHQNTAVNPVSDPDNNATLMSINNGANGTRDFCLRCHDGTPPAGISFPATSYGTGWNKSSYVSSRHDATINIGETNFTGTKDDCLSCHQHHAASGVAETNKTGIYTMIRGKYDKSGNATSDACNPWDNNDNGDYQLCWDCHFKEMVDKNDGTYGVNAFDDRHDTHVDGEESPCIICHDVHNPYDIGEPGHINFVYGSSAKASNDNNLFSGQSGSFYISGSRGYCSLRCHETFSGGCGRKGHNPKNYDRFPLTYPWGYLWPK